MKTDKKNGNGAKPRRENDNGNNVTGKKPFDKKKYRLQKYSNKYKVEQWEDRRKKAVLRGFYKELHKDSHGAPEKPLHLKTSEPEKDSNSPKKKKSAFFAAKKEFQKNKAEKQKKKDELLKIQSERKEALNNYKEKRMEMYKKLSKKTKKGQPVMKDRLEMLLEKIKESVS